MVQVSNLILEPLKSYYSRIISRLLEYTYILLRLNWNIILIVPKDYEKIKEINHKLLLRNDSYGF